MPLLGYDIFAQSDSFLAEDGKGFLCRRGTGVVAIGQLLEDGKIKVLKSSKATLEETQSFQSHPYKKLKDELIKMKRLVIDGKVLVFTDDYIFDSSSAAAAVIQGRSASGPLEWKTSDGATLKEVLNASLKS